VIEIVEQAGPWMPLMFLLGALVLFVLGLFVALQRAGKD